MEMENMRQMVRLRLAALRTAEGEEFSAGTRKLTGSDSLPILFTPGVDPGDDESHLVHVGGRMNVPLLARGLACGIISSDRGLVDAKRTDGNGQFWVRLSTGAYRFRFVDHVRDAADIDILARVGDESALKQLEATISNSALPSGLREIALQASTKLEQSLTQADKRQLLKRGRQLGAILKEAPGQSYVATTVVAELSAMSLPYGHCTFVSRHSDLTLAAKSAEVEPTGTEFSPGEIKAEFSSDGKAVRIECPTDRMPFGIGCSLACEHDVETDDVVLKGAKVFSARRGVARPDVRLGLITVKEWLEEPQRLEVVLIPATDDEAGLYLFAEFRQAIEEELQRPDVADDTELSDSICSLLERIDAITDDIESPGGKDVHAGGLSATSGSPDATSDSPEIGLEVASGVPYAIALGHKEDDEVYGRTFRVTPEHCEWKPEQPASLPEEGWIEVKWTDHGTLRVTVSGLLTVSPDHKLEVAWRTVGQNDRARASAENPFVPVVELKPADENPPNEGDELEIVNTFEPSDELGWTAKVRVSL